jgi:hypothetical protein
LKKGRKASLLVVESEKVTTSGDGDEKKSARIQESNENEEANSTK